MILLKQLPVEIHQQQKNKLLFLNSFFYVWIVHIGGGLWGIFAVPIFRRTLGPDATGELYTVGEQTWDLTTFKSIIYRITIGESWRVRLLIRSKKKNIQWKSFQGTTQFFMYCCSCNGMDSCLLRTSLCHT